MKKICFAALFLLLACIIGASSSGVTSVFDLGTSVRAQSLGGAFTAAVDDPGCIYFNPASLHTLERTRMEAAYIPMFFDTAYSYILIGLPTVDVGTFGFSAAMIRTGNLTIRDAGGTKLYDSSQVLFESVMGWGRDFFDERLSLGVNARLDYHYLENFTSDIGAGIDVGALYRVIQDKTQVLNAGLTLRNALEPALKLGTGDNTVPRRLVAGISYNMTIIPEISAAVYADFTAPLWADFDFAAGIEGVFYKTVSLRIGFNSYGIYSAGAGVNILDIAAIDYGLFISEIDTQHRLALKMFFGENIPEQRREKVKIEAAKIEKKAKELAAKELLQLRGQIDKMTGAATQKERFKAVHYTRGIEAYFDGDLKTSAAEFDAVYQADSAYMNVQYYLSMLKGMLGRSNQDNYTEEVLTLYRDGVAKYLKQDYAGARDSWQKILKADPYNKLAMENLKEVNSLLRDIDGMKENK